MAAFDCVIVGGGPGGYVAAIRAAQLGLKTALVERARMGGQCLNWGCIPSKALMESAKLFDRIGRAGSFGIDGIDPAALRFNWRKASARKDKIVLKLVRGVEFLMKKSTVDVVQGEAVIEDAGRVRVDDRLLETRHILLATGAVPDDRALASLPASLVATVPAFFARQDLPDEILVWGANGAACEIALMLRLSGHAVRLAAPDQHLLGFLDHDLRDYVHKRMVKLGIPLHLGVAAPHSPEAGQLSIEGETFPCGLVVNSADRLPVVPRLGSLHPARDGRGFLVVDGHGRTNVPGLYAAGDVTGLLWAQAASAQGTAAVSHMAGREQPVDVARIPVNLYLDPEIAAVGMTEEQLKELNLPYRKGEFSLSVNGKALAEGNTEGFVKVLATEPYGEVVGVHVVAASATDLISEAVAHMKLEATLEDVAGAIHAHPTLSEAFWEASVDALERPLHK
ncbi:MAG: FAD-dependent oxidoreductase [bacterium]|jgi:dihydrolipoamide dehydrogenase|nr:FAD-dependent oxidoreductase [bacterium]